MSEGRHELVFQSHAGSIEALHPEGPGQPQARFQSHAGSIEAGYHERHAVRNHRFNPTLVRLRRGWRRSGRPFRFPFQSHAGSIEAIPLAGEVSIPEFVSIPRWFD